MAKLFFLIAANFGLPLNSWASFIFLLMAFGIVLIGEIKSGRRLWGWALAVTVIVIALRLALPSHEIREGHAVFSPGNEMQSVLPEDVFQSMRRHYDDLELEFRIRPDPRGWAFSMDAIWRYSDLSRWREDLDFGDRWKARFGALNDVRHDYYRNGLKGYGAYLPLVFRFDLPASTMGGELCWRGTVYWPTAEGVHEKFSNNEWECRKIPDRFSSRFLTVYAEDFESGTALSMRLQGTGFFDYGPLVRHALGVIGALAAILLLGWIKPAGLFLGLLALEKRIDSGIGVDVSRPAIAAALEMKKNHPPGASIDFKHLSEIDALPEGEFDVVSMVDVLHHIPPVEREKAIVQACSGVRPGGILLYKDMVTRPRWRSWANAFHDLIISAEPTTTQDVKAVVSWCANAGLEAEKILTRNMLWYGHEMVVFRKRDGK